MKPTCDTREHRHPGFPVLPEIVHRWSPRAMSGGPLTDEEVGSLFEAARWAPSASNNQPWRFLYARRESEHWPAFFGLLVGANQRWCHQAGLLAVVVSKTVNDFNGKPIRTHAYCTGAAWSSLAIQGASLGLVVHGMAGFDYDRAREVLNLPPEYEVQAMFAVGHPGEIEDLPEDLQPREKPSGRKEIREIAWEGGFPLSSSD